MTNDLILALEITGVGMTLVFGMILVLWLMMLILMRITADRPADAALPADDTHALKQQAAAIAVATALAQQQDVNQPHLFPLPPTAIVTAWQAVQRGRLLSQKGPKR